MEAVMTAISTSMTSISTDVMSAVATILPIGLGIFAVGVVVNYAKKFFKKVSN